MTETTTNNNTNQSPSNARQIEIENEVRRLRLQERELELTEKRLGSWRTDNDTINSLFEMLKWPVSILVLALVANYIYESNKTEILSMGSGCEIPPSLVVELDIPNQPYMSEESSPIDYIEMKESDTKGLIAALIRRDNDRAEIRRICGI